MRVLLFVSLLALCGSACLDANATPSVPQQMMSMEVPAGLPAKNCTGSGSVCRALSFTSTTGTGTVAYTLARGAYVRNTDSIGCQYGQFNISCDNTVFGNSVQVGGATGTIASANSSIPLKLSGNMTDGASAIGVSIFNANTLSTVGALIASFENPAATKKATVDLNGSYTFVGNPTLQTCAAGIEGQVSRDVLSGLATGKRTKLCLCTSNGSSVYAWQNLATATLGTTTTCGTE